MNLIIVGATARAAAFSAHRAGLRPWCVDLFADADLARRFPVRRVPPDAFPDGLLTALADAPDGPLLYTGGLENHPALLEGLDRPLWGNPPEVLRRVRSPFLLAEALRRHGLPALDVRRDPPPPGNRRQWLLKPLAGGGGLGIRTYTGQSFNPQTHYLQEYWPGYSFGVLYLGLPCGQALLLGVSSLIYPDWLHAPARHYCGNIGPLRLHTPHLQALGDLLAGEFSLRGLFGIDTIGAKFLLEVNPRYTASVEVIERALRIPLLQMHRAVFEREPIAWQPSRPPMMCGKAILYARDDVEFPADGPWRNALGQTPAEVEYADIPHAGERIARGRPILTLFASSPTGPYCWRALRDKAKTLDRRLWPA